MLITKAYHKMRGLLCSPAWHMFVAMTLQIQNLVTATTCSDAANSKGLNDVLRMCEDGTFIGSRLVLDTYDAHLYGIGSCSCSISTTADNTTNSISYDKLENLHPSVGDCGSTLAVKVPSLKTELNLNCGIFPNVTEIQGKASFDIIWSTARNDSISGYCMLVEFNSTTVKLNATCHETDRLRNSSSTLDLQTPTSATTDSSNSTGRFYSLSTETLNKTTLTVEVATTPTSNTTHAVPPEQNASTSKSILDILIPAAAAASGFVLVIAVITLVIICRKRKMTKEPYYNNNNSNPLVNINHETNAVSRSS